MNEFFGLHEGFITDNRDPEGLGRVRLTVPNLLPDEGSSWAYPMGAPGAGSAQRGFWDVPAVGAEVYVMFLGGDPDKPRYLTGHWGRGEQPTAVRDVLGEAESPEQAVTGPTQVHAWETPSFAIFVDERVGKRRMLIHAKAMGQDLTGEALAVELDLEQAVVALSGIGGISIVSSGRINIEAPVVSICGRIVSQATKAPL